MNSPRRIRYLRVAAVLSLMVAFVGLTVYDVPNLVKGADGAADPYWLVLGSFATDVLAILGAYGAWTRQRWGVVVLLVVNAFWLLQAISTLIDPTQSVDVAFALVMTAIHVVTVFLLPGPTRVDRGDRHTDGQSHRGLSDAGTGHGLDGLTGPPMVPLVPHRPRCADPRRRRRRVRGLGAQSGRWSGCGEILAGGPARRRHRSRSQHAPGPAVDRAGAP
jgi:hypothetical protein